MMIILPLFFHSAIIPSWFPVCIKNNHISGVTLTGRGVASLQEPEVDVHGMELVPDLRARFNVDTFREQQTPSAPRPTCDDLFWHDVFQREFVERQGSERDDILFFVKWDSKLEVETVEVMRRDSRALPRPTDTTVFWDKTLYLNLILHEFDYHVSCGVITVKPGSETIDSVKMSIVHQVYPSPNERRMDKKGKVSAVIYPYIMFCVDDFEEIFAGIHVSKPGEKIAVQLVVTDKLSSVSKVVFVGAVDYSTIKPVYEKKAQVPITEKLKRFTLKPGSRTVDLNKRFCFIQMRGPRKVGFAEVAIGSGDLGSDGDSQPTEAMQRPEPHSHNGSSGTETSIKDSDRVLEHSPPLVASGSPESGPGRASSPTHPGSTEHRVDGSPDTNSVGSSGNGAGDRPEAGDSEGMSGSNDKAVKAKKGSSRKKFSQALPKIYRRRRSSENSCNTMLAYLTYIQLPWYTLLEDILNGTKPPVL